MFCLDTEPPTSRTLVTSRMKIKDLKLRDNELILSFDVVSLFTQVPIDDAFHIIRDRLEADVSLEERTTFTVQQMSPD